MKKSNYRELTWNEIINMLNKIQYCRLAVAKDNQPYVVPVYFNYKFEKNNIKFTLHSEDSGSKIQCMNSNNKVCLEFDRNIGNAIDSIIVIGEAKICNNPCEINSAILEVTSSNVTGRRTFMTC